MKFCCESKIEAPSSAEVEVGLRDMAMRLGVDLVVTTIKTGWIFKTDHVYFKATSEQREKLENFIKNVKYSIEQYDHDNRRH